MWRWHLDNRCGRKWRGPPISRGMDLKEIRLAVSNGKVVFPFTRGRRRDAHRHPHLQSGHQQLGDGHRRPAVRRLHRQLGHQPARRPRRVHAAARSEGSRRTSGSIARIDARRAFASTRAATCRPVLGGRARTRRGASALHAKAGARVAGPREAGTPLAGTARGPRAGRATRYMASSTHLGAHRLADAQPRERPLASAGAAHVVEVAQRHVGMHVLAPRVGPAKLLRIDECRPCER